MILGHIQATGAELQLPCSFTLATFRWLAVLFARSAQLNELGFMSVSPRGLGAPRSARRATSPRVARTARVRSTG